VAVCPSLCSGKKGKKEVKTLGSPPGAFDKIFFSDPESIKKYLDRTTRETLEAEVKGLKLLAMVLEKEGSYIFSSKEGLSEDLKKQVLEKIEQIKED
jgi:hypothetical protein